MARRPAPFAILAIVVAVAAWLAWLTYLSVYQVDDAFIVYRYARNIAHGLGIVFNPGERVEGVTCLLWTLVLAAFSRMGVSLPAVTPVLTSLAGAATLAILPFVSARLAGRKELTAGDFVPTVLLAASPIFSFWSVGALESVPFALLVTLALHARLRERERGSGVASALWLGVAAWMRPETPILAAALVLHDLACPAPGASRWRRGLGLAAIFGGFLAALVLFRLAYFGDALPNTYYAKAGGPLGSRLTAGLWYTRNFATTIVPSFGSESLVAEVAGLAILGALVVWGFRDPRLRAPAALIAALAVAVVFEGGDWMPLHRFWVPVLPAIALLAGAAIARLAARQRVAAAAVVLVVAAGQIAHGVRARDGANGLAVNAEGYRHAHLEVARFLSERARPDDVVALMDVGMIGYLTNLPIIDISGLTDRDVARSPGPFMDKRYPVENLLERAPRFFVLVDGFPIDSRIALNPEFAPRYELVFERNHRFNWTPPGSYTLHVFERRADGVAR